MEPLTVQTLIGEVAKRHGVTLDSKDPIFITVTLNERVLAHYLERMNALLEHAQNAANAQIAQQIAAAKEVSVQPLEEVKAAASKLMNEGVAHIAERVKATGDDVQRQIAKAAEDAIQRITQAKRVALVVSVTAGVLSAFALGVAASILLMR